MNLSQAISNTASFRWANQKSYETSLRNVAACVDYLGSDIPLESITTPILRRMVKHWMDAGLSGATCNRRLSALSAVLKDALDDGEIQTTPSIPRAPEAPGRERVLSDGELAELIPLLGPFGPLAQFMVSTGARRSEAMGLRWDTVGEDYVIFSETKSGRDRKVPLNAYAQNALKVYEGQAGGPFLWASTSAFNRAWIQARNTMNVSDPQFVPHALRHTFASRLVAKGVDISTVSRLLGHADIQTTMRYAHHNQETLKKAVELL